MLKARYFEAYCILKDPAIVSMAMARVLVYLYQGETLDPDHLGPENQVRKSQVDMAAALGVSARQFRKYIRAFRDLGWVTSAPGEGLYLAEAVPDREEPIEYDEEDAALHKAAFAVLRGERVTSITTARVLIFLYEHGRSGVVYLSQQELADAMGLSLRQIQRHLRRLRDLGWVAMGGCYRKIRLPRREE